MSGCVEGRCNRAWLDHSLEGTSHEVRRVAALRCWSSCGSNPRFCDAWTGGGSRGNLATTGVVTMFSVCGMPRGDGGECDHEASHVIKPEYECKEERRTPDGRPVGLCLNRLPCGTHPEAQLTSTHSRSRG